MPGYRRLILVMITLACTNAVATPTQAAPDAELWPRWQTHDPASTATIDHAVWAGLLERYLRTADDGVNRVAYGAVTGADRIALDTYVADLAALPISTYARPEQMAYWINLYNALTVKVIVDHFPVDSIRDIDISPGFFNDGPWGKQLIEVEGEPLALDDIEHRILRPIWRDPRVHYAVNCASIGCPNLQPEPFRAADLDAQLTRAAAEYVNHPRGVLVDGDHLEVSSIYRWFRADFGDSDQGVIDHLRAYATPALRARLDGLSSIDDDDYDWSLNAAATASRSGEPS